MGFYRDYTTPPDPSAFVGINALKKRYKNLTRGDIMKKLADVEAYSRLREVRKVKKYNPFIVRRRLEVLQLDLLEIGKLKEANESVAYILMIVDTFSRKAWGVLLENKTAPTVRDAFRSFLLRELNPDLRKEIGRVLCDRGGEFANKEFRPLLKRFNIKLSHPNVHAPHVERFNRSIQKILYSYLIEKRTRRYLEMLPQIFSSYNNRIHSAHGLTPNEAFKKENSFKVNRALEYNLIEKYPKKREKKKKFGVGDHVRILNSSNKFQRSYKDTYSVQIYTVSGIVSSPLPIIMYKLSDLRGRKLAGFYYGKQLVKVNFKENLLHVKEIVEERTRPDGTREVKVRWLGHTKRYDSWIKEEELERYT